jgi:Glycosyl hydrolases family 43
VGEDYYLAGTTMHMNPAVQIMHSKDLVNWELAGYCMDRLDLGPAFRLESGNIYGRGIWAPCMRKGRVKVSESLTPATVKKRRADFAAQVPPHGWSMTCNLPRMANGGPAT